MVICLSVEILEEEEKKKSESARSFDLADEFTPFSIRVLMGFFDSRWFLLESAFLIIMDLSNEILIKWKSI